MNGFPNLARLPIPHIFLALFMLFGAGCGSPNAHPPTYVFVVDYSASTADIRRKELGAMLSELETVSDGATIVVYRMGFDTQEIYSGPIDDTAIDTVTTTLERDTTKSDPTLGTDFAKMAEALEAFTKRFNGYTCLVRVLTDGGNDFSGDQSNMKTYRQAAGAVCADKRIASLTFFGIKPGFREELRSVWGSAGSRLEVLGQDQLVAN